MEIQNQTQKCAISLNYRFRYFSGFLNFLSLYSDKSHMFIITTLRSHIERQTVCKNDDVTSLLLRLSREIGRRNGTGWVLL